MADQILKFSFVFLFDSEKNADGEDTEPLVSKEDEVDSQTEITSPDQLSTSEVQPSSSDTGEPVASEPTQVEVAAVKEEEVDPIDAGNSTDVGVEPASVTVEVAEASETEAPVPEDAPLVATATQDPEQPQDDHHDRTYAEVVASNIPEERDSVNEDHPLMGDANKTAAGSKSSNPAPGAAQPTPEFDETSELTVEPAVAPAESVSTPEAVEKEVPKESPKEETSFFTCLSSFKFW